MRRLAGFLVCLGMAFGLRGDAVPVVRKPVVLRGTPPMMLWAWEEPENLRELDPVRAGVAFLAERVTLGEELSVEGRRQRILVPQGVWAEAVVRVETAAGFKDTQVLREATARELVRVAGLPGIKGVQVDFDAVRSQRDFYADVLRRARAGMPEGIGLSMTALVSWCSVDGGWLSGLPVDEAVPMYFRLGKQVGRWPVKESLCMGARGISSDELESAPAGQTGRVYLFAPRPWTADQVAAVNAGRVPVAAKGER